MVTLLYTIAKLTISKDTITGKYGEYSVCADAIRQLGCYVQISDHDLPHDVTLYLDRDCNDNIKGQVKTTDVVHNGRYKFTGLFGWKDNRHNQIGDYKPKKVSKSPFDFLALVAKPIQKIAYFKPEELISKDGTFRTSMTLLERDFDEHSKLSI